MTAYYVEPKSYSNYTATPPNTTTAYDGDGLAKGVATPAVTTIDCTSLTAAATDTLIVCGATLTCVASGAGNNQFNAGSGSTLASNLVTAINRAGNTVTCVAPQSGWMLPLVQNACYASSSGATLTIQTRCGSAKYNTATSATWIVTGTGGLSTVNASFTGGASGAWGFLINDSDDGSSGTMWPSGVTRTNYGVWKIGAGPTGAHGPIAGPSAAGAIVQGDIIHVRCNGKLLQLSTDNQSAVQAGDIRRGGLYLFDDGTEWAGDTGWYTINTRSGSVYKETFALQGYTSTGTMQYRVILANRGGKYCTND